MAADTKQKLQSYFKDCEKVGRKLRVGPNLFLTLNVHSCSVFVRSSSTASWINIGTMQYKDVYFWDNCCRIGANLFQDGFLAKL